jgi:sortase A
VTGRTLSGPEAAVEAPGAGRHGRWRRFIATSFLIGGVLLLGWTVLVWQWQDPFTGLYTRWEQRDLRIEYAHIATQWKPPVLRLRRAARVADERAAVARAAAAYRAETHPGEGIGRLVIGRLGLHMILVDGTDEGSLKKGPGRDLRSYMPGQNRLVYIAGHRTTYLAPFAHIDAIRAGDYIRLELPYGTFVYRAFRHEIVPATDMAMLRSPKHELLRLQACHPRFFATHRYIVDARLVHVTLPDGHAYAVASGRSPPG